MGPNSLMVVYVDPLGIRPLLQGGGSLEVEVVSNGQSKTYRHTKTLNSHRYIPKTPKPKPYALSHEGTPYLDDLSTYYLLSLKIPIVSQPYNLKPLSRLTNFQEIIQVCRPRAKACKLLMRYHHQPDHWQHL